MEKTTLESLLQSNGNARQTTESNERSRCLQEAKTLMSQVKANFPSQDIPQPTALLWLDAWADLGVKHGLHWLKEGLRHWNRTGRFLPLPADVADAIAHVKSQRRATVAEVDKYVPCSDCHDGWKLFEEERAGYDVPVRFVFRCPCRLEWVAQHKAAAA